MQTGDSFEFALRLCGQGNIWQECAKYVVDRDQGLLQFPVKVRYLPIYVYQEKLLLLFVFLFTKQTNNETTPHLG